MILITGATGTVGSETVRRLAGARHQVRALVRDPAKAATLGDGVEIAIADLTSPETLTAAFDGVDRVLVIAPVAPDLETLEANAFRAAAEAGVKHIVKLSNLAAGSFDTNLWQWHEASENTLRALGIPWTILRATRFMNYAPFSWAPVVGQGQIIESTGGGTITLIDPSDVAAVAAEVLTTAGHEAKTYGLTSAEFLTGDQIAQKITAATNRSVTFTDAPPEAFADALLAAGTPPFMVEMTLQYFTLIRERRVHVTTTVAELLGRPPRRYDDWLRDNAAERIRQAEAEALDSV
jgi:uncharacterized protein YbjT (DUF2867 family)